MPVIEVDRLHKRYGARGAVHDVSFAVEEGEIFGILGPNGAGKTTAVGCIEGLRSPDGGSISVLGLDPRRAATGCGRCWASSCRPVSCRTGCAWGRPCSVRVVLPGARGRRRARGPGLMVAVGLLGLDGPFPRRPRGFAATFVAGTSAVFAIGLLIAALVPRAKPSKFLLPDVVVQIGSWTGEGPVPLQLAALVAIALVATGAAARLFRWE